MHVVALGDLNLDVLVELPLDSGVDAGRSIGALPAGGGELRGWIEVVPGGAAATFARVAAAEGAEVILVACVGDDPAGQILRGELERDGVRLLGRCGRGRTGVVISVGTADSASNMHTMICDRGANDDLAPEIVDLLDVGQVDHLHVSGYALLGSAQLEVAHAVMRACSEHHPAIPVSVDPPPAKLIEQVGREWFLRELDRVQMVFPNEEEALLLTASADVQSAVDALASRFQMGAVTLGDRGAVVWDERQVSRIAIAPVASVNTTGAGDAFAAGFVIAVHQGVSAAEVGRRAAECAGRWLERRSQARNRERP